eukprot:TRINITY_DN6629_c0_g1_i1.p2 TRINITY_DN6629_c0_g1~~TRINITY_DN6629_c0_g1_i1.p2  ORF type:complete len:537 (+),score=202.41 TRINITY_DN6629_c0_g1_i1:31-1611(+)
MTTRAVAVLAGLLLLACAAQCAEEGFIACPVTSKIERPSNLQQVRAGVPFTALWDAAEIDADTLEVQLWELDLNLGTDTLVETLSEAAPNSGEFVWSPQRYGLEEGERADFYLYLVSNEQAGEALTSFCFYIVYDLTAYSAATDSLLAISVRSSEATAVEIELWAAAAPDAVTLKRGQLNNPGDAVVVFEGLQPDTLYRYRMRGIFEGGESPFWAWELDQYEDRTQVDSTCEHEVVASFFAQMAYFDWPSDIQVQWCGTWDVVFRYSEGVDHVFVHRNLDSSLLVVSHRGTESDNLPDVIDNISLLSSCAELGCEGDARTAFVGAYEDAMPSSVRGVIESEVAAGYDTLLLTGHSQGAALATVAAMDIASNVGPLSAVHLITFGSPKIANEQFAAQLSAKLASNKRVVQSGGVRGDDYITTIGPPLAQHVAPKSAIACQCPTESIGTHCHCVDGYAQSIHELFAVAAPVPAPVPNPVPAPVSAPVPAPVPGPVPASVPNAPSPSSTASIVRFSVLALVLVACGLVC